MTIIDNPRTLVLNGVSFSVDDIKHLKGLFPQMDMLVMPKTEIRKDPVLQKAVVSGAVSNNFVETGTTATLSLTQAGRALAGKV